MALPETAGDSVSAGRGRRAGASQAIKGSTVDVAEQSGRTSFVTIGLIAFACWTALGAVESVNAFIGNLLRGTPRSWVVVLINNMPWWYTWLFLTPAILWVAHLAPLDSRRWKRSFAVHAVTGFVLSVAHLVIEGSIFFLLRPAAVPGPVTAWGQIIGFLYSYLMIDLLTYWAVVGGYSAFVYRQRLRAGAVRSARLEAQSAQLALGLVEARMHALRMELNPHFLFNTLNAISGLVRKQEGPAAIEMLARLATLLRTTLDQELSPVISVSEEIALLRQYLEIERVRFGDRLEVHVNVHEGASTALIPTLLLQPLVENAVKHGVSSRSGKARIDVDIWCDETRLFIAVQDTGNGISSQGANVLQEGVGLSNSRARLRALYGNDAALVLRNGSTSGARVEINMPLSPAGDSMITLAPA